MSNDEFVDASNRLSAIIEELDRTKPLLREAYQILRPILNAALSGELSGPGELPHRRFFYGMYEDSLPANYLNDVRLMNAIAAFDEAWRRVGS
jgi:hypothetical protein